ncbi:MAG TPA: PAS domain S-box protein [Flavobacterium sp.]|jgi:PAS domain S-box-containing protein
MNSGFTVSNASFLEGGGQMGALIRNKDWSATPVGNPETWPSALKTCVRIILTSRQPMFIWWGEEFTNIYNDAYMAIIGDKHPAALGANGRETWSEIWHVIGPRAETVMRDNIGTYDEALLLLMMRTGYVEETYFTFSYSPVMGEDGTTKGLFCANTDESQRIITERHLHTLKELARNLQSVQTNAHVYDRTIESLLGNPKDFPFVVLYEVSGDGKQLSMVSKLPADLPENLSKPHIDIVQESQLFPELAETMTSAKATIIAEVPARYGSLPGGFWDKSPSNVLLLPITQSNKQHPVAVMAVGLNPYRQPDPEYLQFFRLIADQIANSLVNVQQIDAIKTKNHYDRQIRDMFLQAPIAISVLQGPTFVVETVNEKMVHLWGKSEDELLGKPVFDAMPDARGQGLEDLLQHVYLTGESFVANERQLELVRNGKLERLFVKFIYKALRDEDMNITRVMVLGDDITEQVQARKDIEESESRNKIAIEAAEIGTFEVDLIAEEFIYSERLAEIFGLKQSGRFKQSDFTKLIHPDDLVLRKEAISMAYKTGVLFYEARFIQPDNNIVWVRLNGKLSYDDEGRPVKIFGTARDVSDYKIQSYILEKKVEDRTRTLKKKNEELKQSEERYQRMTEEVQDYAILLLDTSGTILNWNKGAENIKGYKEEEIVGKNIRIFYLPEDQKTNLPQKLINKAATEGRATHEGYRIRKDGTVFWGSMALTALHDKNNNVIGFSKVTRDLTERKLAEDKIKKYNSELEFQNKELEQFAFVASHDLQEPLRKIQMFSDMLERNLHDAAAVKKYFSKINSSAERMSELIRAVLNYSRLSRLDEHFQVVNLNVIMQNVLTDFELLIEEKHAVIKSHELPLVKAIPLQINQLFSNLIGNALKFSLMEPEIVVTSRVLTLAEIPHRTNLSPDRQYLELVVSDNGIGFEQKYATQIFTIFQRLNDKSSFAGTGIGLALCKKIVENHHGFITAQSAVGEGARFEIYIPYEPGLTEVSN